MSLCSILLVDDEEELRDLPRHFLERAGHLVACAKHGFDANLAITGGSFDVVVRDMLMPGARRVRIDRRKQKNFLTAKIVAISGGGLIGRDQYGPMARGFGADVWLRKPFAYHALLSAVKRARAGRN